MEFGIASSNGDYRSTCQESKQTCKNFQANWTRRKERREANDCLDTRQGAFYIRDRFDRLAKNHNQPVNDPDQFLQRV